MTDKIKLPHGIEAEFEENEVAFWKDAVERTKTHITALEKDLKINKVILEGFWSRLKTAERGAKK